MSKISDSTSHMPGIRFIGYKGVHEFFMGKQEDQSKIFNFFTKYCIRFHLTNEYNIIKLIGKGNFSRVAVIIRCIFVKN